MGFPAAFIVLDWLALGTVLLILEVFGAGGYLLWMGITLLPWA